MNTIKASGILPIAIKNGDIYFLAGSECDTKKYCGFGGMIDKNENSIECAIREGYEETLGVIGDKIDIYKLILNHLITSIFVNHCYIEYIIQIDYDEKLIDAFSEKYLFVKKNNNVFNLSSCYFEKIKLKWFPLKNYKQYIYDFRECFLPVLEQLTLHFYEKTS